MMSVDPSTIIPPENPYSRPTHVPRPSHLPAYRLAGKMERTSTRSTLAALVPLLQDTIDWDDEWWLDPLQSGETILAPVDVHTAPTVVP